jgi:thiamine-phosphate pyrophosphorylase
MNLPRLYAIIDAACFSGETNKVAVFAAELTSAGATLLQYRNKIGTSRQMLSQGRELRRKLSGRAQLIMNDRADLCLGASFDGVHLGQDDISVAGARAILGSATTIGLSTHNLQQFQDAVATSADYIALGPIFSTRSKQNPDPEVGLKTLAQARKLTGKPIVAIGGISRENCRSVIDAGADSIAVISDLLDAPGKRVEEFLRVLG